MCVAIKQCAEYLKQKHVRVALLHVFPNKCVAVYQHATVVYYIAPTRSAAFKHPTL